MGAVLLTALKASTIPLNQNAGRNRKPVEAMEEGDWENLGRL